MLPRAGSDARRTSLGVRLRTAARDVDRDVVFDFEHHHLVAELDRETPRAGGGVFGDLALVGNDIGLARREVARGARLRQQTARGVGRAVAQVEVEPVFLRPVHHEEKIGGSAVVEEMFEEHDATVDLGVVQAQGGHHCR